MLRQQAVTRAEATAMVLEVATWDAGHAYAAWVHAGDLGWLLRQPDDVLAAQLRGWWDDDDLVAVSLDDASMSRPRVRPDRLGDLELAAAVADEVETMAGAQLWCDAEPGTALRQELVARGWVLDPEPWVALFADARVWRPDLPAHPGATRRAETEPAARVAVQRGGFARSTFTEEAWHRMAAGPGYRPDLDLVVHDPDDGVAAAAATGWLSVVGGPACLEPLAAAREKQGRGFGRQAVVATIAACLEAGACGVSVATPGDNVAAVATYRSAGMRVMESIQGLMLDR